jgi:hypothetical protein
MTWEFITKPVHSTNAVSREWRWRHIDGRGEVRAAHRTFTSFKECVAERIHGFIGKAQPGDSGTLFQRPQFRFVWY